jgi:hypothetical protein
MSYNWGRPRNRLRKRSNRMNWSFYRKSPYKSLRVTHRHISKTNRGSVPDWNALHRAWVGFVIGKNQYDFEKMRKYATVIRKFQRKLNLEISDFPDIGVSGFEEDFETKAEDDDSKLATIDLWSEDGKDDLADDT